MKIWIEILQFQQSMQKLGIKEGAFVEINGKKTTDGEVAEGTIVQVTEEPSVKISLRD